MNKAKVGLFLGGAAAFIAAIASAAGTPNLLPSADGTYKQWTPKSGATTTHYSMVDEATCNGTTDYVYTGLSGNKDSYVISLASVPTGATITRIDIQPCASRNFSGSGSASINVFYRINGVESTPAGGYALTGTTPVQLATTSFSNLSIVKSVSSTFEVGVIYVSGTRGARLSRIAVRVVYNTSTPPSAPYLFSPVLNTTNTVRLWWTDSDTETGYMIQRSTDDVNYSAVTTTTANVSTTIVQGVPGAMNFYRIYAFNQAGNSAFSNVGSISLIPALPSAPSNLQVQAYSASGTKFAYLYWNDNSNDETGFSVERSNNGYSFTQVGTTGMNQNYLYDWSVTSTYYFYRVSAYNFWGNSGYSNVVTTTVPF